MAAEIKTRPQQRQPVLLNRIDDNSLDITTMMAFTPGEDGLITISEDKLASYIINLFNKENVYSSCKLIN